MESRNISFNVSANQLSINSRFNPKFFNFQKNTKEIFKSKNFDKIIDFSNKEYFKNISDGIHSTVNLIEEGSIRYLYIHNLKNGFIDTVDKLYLDEKDHLLNKSKELKKGLVLVSVVGTIGNTAIFNEDTNKKCSLPRNIAYLETTKNIDPHYVAIFFLSNFGREQAVMNAGGNIQGLLSLGKFKKMKIPLLKEKLSTPLIEKYKESLKLEAMALDLISDAKIKFYKELQINFDSIEKNMSFSIENKKFLQMDLWTPQFAYPYYEKIKLKLQKKFKLTRLRDIREKIIIFKEPGSEYYLDSLEKSDKDLPFIRTSDYFNYELDPNPDYFIEETTSKDFYKTLKDGDVVVTKDGKIGNVAIIFKSQKYVLSAGSIVLRLKKEINPYYVFLCLSSEHIGQNFFKQRTVVASTIPHLKVSRFEDVEIPLIKKEKMDYLGSLVKDAYKLKSKRRVLMAEIKNKINQYMKY